MESNEELLLLVIKYFSDGIRTRSEKGKPILGGKKVLDDLDQTARLVKEGLKKLEDCLTIDDIARFQTNQ